MKKLDHQPLTLENVKEAREQTAGRALTVYTLHKVLERVTGFFQRRDTSYLSQSLFKDIALWSDLDNDMRAEAFMALGDEDDSESPMMKRHMIQKSWLSSYETPDILRAIEYYLAALSLGFEFPRELGINEKAYRSFWRMVRCDSSDRYLPFLIALLKHATLVRDQDKAKELWGLVKERSEDYQNYVHGASCAFGLFREDGAKYLPAPQEALTYLKKSSLADATLLLLDLYREDRLVTPEGDTGFFERVKLIEDSRHTYDMCGVMTDRIRGMSEYEWSIYATIIWAMYSKSGAVQFFDLKPLLEGVKTIVPVKIGKDSRDLPQDVVKNLGRAQCDIAHFLKSNSCEALALLWFRVSLSNGYWPAAVEISDLVGADEAHSILNDACQQLLLECRFLDFHREEFAENFEFLGKVFSYQKNLVDVADLKEQARKVLEEKIPELQETVFDYFGLVDCARRVGLDDFADEKLKAGVLSFRRECEHVSLAFEGWNRYFSAMYKHGKERELIDIIANKIITEEDVKIKERGLGYLLRVVLNQTQIDKSVISILIGALAQGDLAVFDRVEKLLKDRGYQFPTVTAELSAGIENYFQSALTKALEACDGKEIFSKEFDSLVSLSEKYVKISNKLQQKMVSPSSSGYELLLRLVKNHQGLCSKNMFNGDFKRQFADISALKQGVKNYFGVKRDRQTYQLVSMLGSNWEEDFKQSILSRDQEAVWAYIPALFMQYPEEAFGEKAGTWFDFLEKHLPADFVHQIKRYGRPYATEVNSLENAIQEGAALSEVNQFLSDVDVNIDILKQAACVGDSLVFPLIWQKFSATLTPANQLDLLKTLAKFGDAFSFQLVLNEVKTKAVFEEIDPHTEETLGSLVIRVGNDVMLKSVLRKMSELKVSTESLNFQGSLGKAPLGKFLQALNNVLAYFETRDVTKGGPKDRYDHFTTMKSKGSFQLMGVSHEGFGLLPRMGRDGVFPETVLEYAQQHFNKNGTTRRNQEYLDRLLELKAASDLVEDPMDRKLVVECFQQTVSARVGAARTMRAARAKSEGKETGQSFEMR